MNTLTAHTNKFFIPAIKILIVILKNISPKITFCLERMKFPVRKFYIIYSICVSNVVHSVLSFQIGLIPE